MSLGSGPQPRTLAITRHALDDLGLGGNPVLVGRDPRDLVDEHPVIAGFVAKRASNAVGQEPTLGIKPTTYNLHQGLWRAVTWYDGDTGVCWLLAANQAHDYVQFQTRAANGELLPLALDQADLLCRDDAEFESLTVDDFIDTLLEQCEALRSWASARAGTEVRTTLCGALEVSLYHQIDGAGQLTAVYVTYRVPPLRPLPSDDDLGVILETFLLLSTGVTEPWYPMHPARPVAKGREVVVRWTPS